MNSLTTKLRTSRFILLTLLFLSHAELFGAVVEGRVADQETGLPLPFVTIQVAGTGKSTMVNNDGKYRVVLDAGNYQLRFSHIGYYTEIIQVDLADTLVVRDVSLRRSVLVVPGLTVYDRQYDPAQKIILEAIRRKKEILDRFHDYQYDAYTKTVLRNIKKDSAEIMFITETQSKSYWEKPDKYKEVLLARHQTANMSPAENLLTIGEILNFNKNRLDIGHYAVVSPVAEDALGYYNYHLRDSTAIDQRKVYILEVEPKNQADALVAGTVQIVDSTFDVVGVDVGFNEGLRLSFVSDLRYRQRFAQFENQYWMPVEMSFSALVTINFLSKTWHLSGEMVASILDYSFEKGNPRGTFNEYAFEVAEKVDDVDSATWASKQTVPLTADELKGYARIDSVKKAPKPLYKQALTVGLGVIALTLGGDYDIFHYNRVEGKYAGLALNTDRLIPATELWAKCGYAIEAELGEYQFGFRNQSLGNRKVSLGTEYKRRIVSRPVITKGWYNPTFETMFLKTDPFNYYFEQGFSVFASTRLIGHTSLAATFQDYRQQSVGVHSPHGFFGGEEEFRSNPVIADGNLRSLVTEFEYDSRQLWRNKGKDVKLGATQYTLVKIGGEYSSPNFSSSDYDFRKYYISLYRRQRTFGSGITTFKAYAGSSTRSLPPQRYYMVDANGALVPETAGFKTLGDHVFGGSRAAMLNFQHDFGQYLFRKSGLPLVKRIPFTLAAYGGAFWTDFQNHSPQVGDQYINTAPTPYGEVGFGIGNLTPFLGPFNLTLYFTWQLSHYDTNRFSLGWGFKL